MNMHMNFSKETPKKAKNEKEIRQEKSEGIEEYLYKKNTTLFDEEKDFLEYTSQLKEIPSTFPFITEFGIQKKIF